MPNPSSFMIHIRYILPLYFLFSPLEGLHEPFFPSQLKKTDSLDLLKEEDKKMVWQLLEEAATKNMEELKSFAKENKESLEVVYKNLKTIPKLTFVKLILSEPILLQYVRNILQTEEKRIPCLFFLSLKIDEARQEGSLNQSILDIAQLFDLDANIIQRYIEKKLYKNLANYLFNFEC